MTSVLIADDDGLMRVGLAELLASDADITVAGQAADGLQAIDAARRLHPDVVLMDVRMPGLDGIAATERLAATVPAAKVLILTTFEDDDYIFPSLRAGASGFLLKRARPDELIAAVHAVAAGDALLSPSVTRRVIDRMARQLAPPIPARAPLGHLTAREREVLELVAYGLSNGEISARLVVEDATVRSHIRRILMKLHLRDRIQIVIYAYETGIIRPAPGATPP